MSKLPVTPFALGAQQAVSPAAAKANIPVILTDDLGYGNVHCCKPEVTPTMKTIRRIATILAMVIAISSNAQIGPEPLAIPGVDAPTEVQKQMNDRGYGMFICFAPNTYVNKEWSHGEIPMTVFNPAELDCDQWIRVAKEAGFRHVLLLTKHHDGFCLWDTKTTTLNVMNSPLKRDVLADLRKSCDKYGLKLALYFSEGDWSMDRKKATADEQAALKKAQIKELLTHYGPVEFISFDHAQGTGGLNHHDTDQWVRQFQPDCFSGFNNGEAGGRISLRERGTPGPIGQATAMANQMANERGFAFTVAELNYPINRTYWFFNTGAPEYPNLPAAKLYVDYCGTVKYGNIFSLDVGPNLAGKLRDRDVQTLRQVGAMIKNPPPSQSDPIPTVVIKKS